MISYWNKYEVDSEENFPQWLCVGKDVEELNFLFPGFERHWLDSHLTPYINRTILCLRCGASS